MEHEQDAFAACTIVARNYLPRALVLNDSLREFHPGMEFWVLLIEAAALDARAVRALARRGIHLLRVQEIGLPAQEIGNFRFAYDLTEVSTAYKPWMLETVARLSSRHVVYLDPDIQCFGPLTALIEPLRRHELVLTPHVLQPMKRDRCQPTEAAIMGSGIYNLGFLGVNRNATRALSWWQERLKRECYNSHAEQLFTDQRWMDFAPSLFDCHISKDETCNVAYWNADERPIVFEQGRYRIRQQPLTFFHYSGLDEKNPHMLTRHQGRPRVLLSEYAVLTQLVNGYVQCLRDANEECGAPFGAYEFDVFSDGGNISLGCRRTFLKQLTTAEIEGHATPPSPFAPEGDGPFFDWMNEPISFTRGGTPIPRWVLDMREMRPDLVAAFPDPTGHDAIRLLKWFYTQGRIQFLLPPRLLATPVLDEEHPSPKKLMPGLEIIGYLQTESGVGQAARLLARALEHSTVPFATLVDSSAPSRQRHPFRAPNQPALHKDEAYQCCVLCVNADSVAAVRRRLGSHYLEGRPVAGLWFWEVETLPKRLHHAFDEVDEVWVASEFIRRVLAPISPVPVHHVPLPFGLAEAAAPLNRAQWGIPEGFFFLFSFDFHSVFLRKNPVGVVEAFQRAFPEPKADGGGPALVIKGINGDAHLEQLELLRYAARGRRDIVILPDYMEASANQALTAACGCYVSLHRSEGLGLTMAEAMSHGRPVIATAYSGNMDFMTAENSYLCRFEIAPVGSGAPPYCSDAVWAEPDLDHAAELMREVYGAPEAAAAKGRFAQSDLAQRFSPQRCAEILEARWQSLARVKTETRDLKVAEPASVHFTGHVKALRKQWKRTFDPKSGLPSLGTFLFQGPRKTLGKILDRLERHRKLLDRALVDTASDHEKRIGALEQSLIDVCAQNAALLRNHAQAERNRGNSAGEE